MTSLWLAGRAPRPAEPAPLDAASRSAGVVVVGAGITGLITAVLLARAGKDVLVLEARTVGAGATGNTTAKISLLQGSKLSRILAKHGAKRTRQYLDGNREGQHWLLGYCASHGLSVQREDAFTFAQSEQGLATARRELAACTEVGLGAEWVDAEWADGAAVPFPFRGGVRLADQAQFDPVPLLDRLVTELEERGGRLAEGVRVRTVSGGRNRLTLGVRTTGGDEYDVHAKQCVLATGIPILDRGGFFARLKPQRSYCLAYRVPELRLRGMFLSTDSPTRSLRYAPTADGDRLIVGGAGHPVGHERHPSSSVQELDAWTKRHFPGATQTHYWSAQDYAPVDELPYVGPILPGNESVFVATGFDKWGMTNGAAAALALAGRILGGRMDWADAFAAWSPHELSGIPQAVRNNLEVGLYLARGWVTPAAHIGGGRPEAGGVVSGPPWRLRGCAVVDGREYRVSPVCPHLGGIVTWNDADEAWECPLHGSRFAPDGTLLEGPATRGLTPES
ncbi:rieske domain protein [Mycolicibacterium hassiacum DSM 44199]|uniref:Rieske domain protein n=1 Tax=Mycolicibacterium hassiacum (strain DSM 44199 / CIP 105218 / JCM 12690 / 3849) TaxID=1122247 RepID=K5BCX4_MYCHD|nr:FAD-dependent oxidoreductase [Mycolicibacterium hassiacum]EKF25540.1 rieske domain protein [Mycolicibacterium hassiacum DSM 44199]MBX5487878.1 FAD-dependent oxidoreductase [Mycolicibacterium hassiacum]MDA4086605.1 FAD-dependent oxidoreductase [Mycolicibacterium hassiacum DSM 44199]PZN21185.1 MAG: FAD-dependent oxidoreductase [Mycolicibacterium hassiacum]VCT92911.1 Cytochrome b6-f complex iron-sulfur subunit [Mycolicibacterium hassiacum DSM 44199]